MKNILFIASYFPPAGGVGVMRITKFCKYLARDGYGITVLTPAPWSVKRLNDPSMQKDVPPQAKIINPGFIDYRRLIPGEVAKYIRKWERRHFFPDNLNQWVQKIIPQIPEILSIHKIDLAFISLPHFSLLRFAPVIKALGIPVVLDMRDPYSTNPYIVPVQDPWFQTRTLDLERKAFQAATIILNVTETRNVHYQKLYPEWSDKFACIPSGFDDDDFSFEAPAKLTSANPRLTLCYAGSYSAISSIFPYRDAMLRIKQLHNVTTVLRLITPNRAKQVYKDFALLRKHNMLNYLGFLPHRETIRQLQQSDVLLFPLPGVFPAKAYELVRAHKTVLCAYEEEREVHGMIRKANVGRFANLNPTDNLDRALLELNEAWGKNRLSVSPNWEYISSFSYENRTKLLKQVLESI